MARSAKLSDIGAAHKSAYNDYRSHAQKAEEFFLELREHIMLEPESVSRDSLISRLDHFILTGDYLPKPN